MVNDCAGVMPALASHPGPCYNRPREATRMIRRDRGLRLAGVLLALAWGVLGCTFGGNEGAGTPTPTVSGPPEVVFAPEGVFAPRPPRLAQSGGALQVSGRLLSTAPNVLVLRTFYAPATPQRPQEGRVALVDPQGLLVNLANTTPGPLLTLTGIFTVTADAGIEVGTLEVQQITPITLDATALTGQADAAIRAATPQLGNGATYPPLALPDFATVTAQWQPQPDDFGIGGSTFLGVAEDGTPLTYWRGPTLPPHPDRPLVSRWLAIYTRFAGADPRTLLVTLEGQANE
jgi:hypothetical protein